MQNLDVFYRKQNVDNIDTYIISQHDTKNYQYR